MATGSYFDHKLLTFLIRQATPRPKLPMDLGQLVATDVITENCAREGNENHHRRAQTLLLSPCEGTPPAVGRTASRTDTAVRRRLQGEKGKGLGEQELQSTAEREAPAGFYLAPTSINYNHAGRYQTQAYILTKQACVSLLKSK